MIEFIKLSNGEEFLLTLIRDGVEKSVTISAAVNEQGMNMGYRHKRLPLFGLQFHPESILTENGRSILNNWLQTCS